MQDSCPACTSTNVAEVRAVPDHEYGVDYVARYARCSECGTLRQTPMPDLNQLASFYPSHYHAQTSRGMLNRIRQRIRLNRLTRFMNHEGVVLDFGCGNGAFLQLAARRLPHCTYFGFEVAERREILKQRGGIVTIVKGEFGDLMHVLPACGLITMNHVIEHLPDPATTITMLLEKLLPHGVLEGQTPAAGSLEQRVFGDFWSGYHSPRHTVVFSRNGLRQFLERMGLERVKTNGAFNPAGLAVSLASLARGRLCSETSREGLRSIGWIGLATVLAPGDLLSGAPGIQNFRGFKPAG